MTSSRTYTVYLPVTINMAVTVTADSEAEAIDAAMGLAWRLDASGEGHPEIIECEAHRQIVTGNIFRGVLNKAEAQEDV